MRVSLDWLKDFCPFRIDEKELARRLTMNGLEVEAVERLGHDTAFEVNVTPNRADCLSIIGIAREVAAIEGKPLSVPQYKCPKGQGAMKGLVSVSVKSAVHCPRYSARAVAGVRIGPSPEWLVKRLLTCGIRSINNVVDATNYVMLETGQPLHAFDLSLIRGRRIIVRLAGPDATFKTLDGVERKLEAEDLLICDGEGGVALAGIMGGENSQVTGKTTDILIESAYFSPTHIRRTSKRLGLSTDSSRRFERGADPIGTAATLHRATSLIMELAGGVPTADFKDIYPKRFSPAVISLAIPEVERILGLKLSGPAISKLLMSIGLPCRPKGKNALAVKVPTFRPDLERPIDIIEEAARLHGYKNIPETLPLKKMTPIIERRIDGDLAAVRSALVDIGLSEALLYGFTSEQALRPFLQDTSTVRITNPISETQSVMRTTLLDGLLDTLKFNANRQISDGRFFALQHVYMGSEEPLRLASVMTGRRNPGAWERSREALDFFDAKGAVETVVGSLGLCGEAVFEPDGVPPFMHPGCSCRVVCAGKDAGVLGQLHPDVVRLWDMGEPVFAFELDMELLSKLSAGRMKKYSELSKYPFVERDVAVIVDEAVRVSRLEAIVRKNGAGIVDRVGVFDIFRGGQVAKGKKSVALSVRFLIRDRTLTDEEVVGAMDRIIACLKGEAGAEQRT